MASRATRAFAAFFSPDSSIACDGGFAPASSACARTPGGIASNPKASPTANPFPIRPPYFLLIPNPYSLVPVLPNQNRSPIHIHHLARNEACQRRAQEQ